MAFQARHRWLIQKLDDGFGINDEAQVESFLREEETLEAINSFFRADGPPRLFVYYQCRQTTNERGELVAGQGPPEIYVADPELEPMTDKGMYFLRSGLGLGAGQAALDPTRSHDDGLTYGMIDKSPLKSLETLLTAFYRPVFNSREDWGQADEEHKQEFLVSTMGFADHLHQSLKSLHGGLELRKPDLDLDALDSRSLARGHADSQVVSHFSDLLEQWCRQTETYLDDSDRTRWESNDSGPDTELEYWRMRMQRLTSITEQLKTRECKTVIGVLTAVTKANDSLHDKQKVFSLLRRWKQIDLNITEAANEAKDNVKYLASLERFIEPLYNDTPLAIIDSLPALMNSIKMIHTIARYYNTTERMTKLFMKITNQMIATCKKVVYGPLPPERIWDHDPQQLLGNLESCLRLNEAYQEQYRLTKDKLLTMPKGKQFDFSETQIFGKFDLFCRRVIKLIDMFSTIHQFRSLADYALEGMEGLTHNFNLIIIEFKSKRHDLLDYHNNKFDRDYVEFNVRISDLESSLQLFINQSFESITSIEQSLNLLKKFQTILQRESLRSDLDSKFTVIFHNYGLDLTTVQDLYEKCKHNPPIQRNMPPVAGNILWARHLLRRIEEPMRKFESNPNVLATKDSKKIIKTYNKVARTLVAFEYLWYEAWCNAVETAKAGLHATLIIRHPQNNKLYVNFDKEILQLIREGKCLVRMGVDIPENANMVLLQEDKFKMYYNDLSYALSEYDRVMDLIIPVTARLLRPHLEDLDLKLRPGMVTLTWTSMNIDAYKVNIHQSLQRLEALINNINDIVDNRIEKNLKSMSRFSLCDLPRDMSFSLDEFVVMQERHVRVQTEAIKSKNKEIEVAVEDVIDLAQSLPLDDAVEPHDEEALDDVRRHYQALLYQSLLNATRNSLNAIKRRMCARGGTGFLFLERPFFEVDVQLAVPSVRLSPTLDDVQRAINRCAVAVLRCSKSAFLWGQLDYAEDDQISLFNTLGCDLEIIKVLLLLTGAMQGTKNQVHDYLSTFHKYDWLWKDDMEQEYQRFMTRNPRIEDFETELQRFMLVEAEIKDIPPMHNIGALSLNTKNLKLQLRNECRQWKVQYSDKVHQQARDAMESLTEYIRATYTKLGREVDSLDSLRFVMNVLKEVRERESSIEMEINPILDMYQMLEHYLPGGYMDKDEMDQKSVIRTNWRKLVDFAEEVTDRLSGVQGLFKKQLMKDVREFAVDVEAFRRDFSSNGPMVPGIQPAQAVERLNRFKEEYLIRERKLDIYSAGEDLFALRTTEYPELVKTKKEIALLDQLYTLYMDVSRTMQEYREVLWLELPDLIPGMMEVVTGFDARCKKMPLRLKEWDAYKQLRKEITDFSVMLPLLQELSKESIKPRHWQAIMEVTGMSVDVDSETFQLHTILDGNLLDYKEEVEDTCESADKQLQIETKLHDIQEQWSRAQFEFVMWKSRAVPVLKGFGQVIEDLEDAQLQIQSMLSMRHVAPFREQLATKLSLLSDTADTLERWVKVQMLWTSLESVFTGGDIAKQMPLEAKKFAKIDKDWLKLMTKASETGNVVAACSNELLRNALPMLYTELEKCQKSLEGYLEQKRGRFPRFYFVSNPVLLQILSQGSDPQAVQLYYEKIFDSIDKVVHDRMEKQKILSIKSSSGADEEIITLTNPVSAHGNIETWLTELERQMQLTMKDLCMRAASDCMNMDLRQFVQTHCGQFALIGIQFNWTAASQEALERCRQSKHIVSDTNKSHLAVLTELSSWCLTDLGSRMNRTKIETLVTIQVHQRDVFAYLAKLYKERKVQDANDFEWLKQARFYWRPTGKDRLGEGACVISICDVDSRYCYEYLGCKERLVITPLTDRCYVTLSQALGMYLGGAPAGPAGTGKTETVKDLGRSLGIYVVVTNCTDQQRYTDMAKIFKGLCQAGLWGCFDEFNRIELPVLSVVAQQVLAITNAKRAGAPTFAFPGDTQLIALNPDVGYFITMNPGYQGRQELPENLKALFRGVAMMVPDREIIMKVKLCSVGYSDFGNLSRKFRALYSLCEEQLSKQKHYDFGLRNILSVLRTAGQTKRDNPTGNEEMLLMRTLRDMNLSKLVAQDTPLFLSLLGDLFPAVGTPAAQAYPEVERAIAASVEANKLVRHQGWTSKVVQLYETTLVRHGIMLVGPPGSGKSSIISTLQEALSVSTGVPHKRTRMNPKAIRAEEMFGETDKLSGEWLDGVFAAMWSKFNDRLRKDVHWLICDGPVDAIWIENLNTVLDDNKILTLANGERIPMTDNVKLLFEVEDLRNASPATVSRAGIIFVSDTDLDWKPVVDGWLSTLPTSYAEPLSRLVARFIGDCSPGDPGELFKFISRHCKPVIKSSRVELVESLRYLLSGLFQTAELTESPDDLEAELERLFLYAVAWGIGGLCAQDDRVKIDGYLRERSQHMPVLNNSPSDGGQAGGGLGGLSAAPQQGDGLDSDSDSMGSDAGGDGEGDGEGGHHHHHHHHHADTVFDYFVNPETMEWERWTAPSWSYPQVAANATLDFSNLLIPTLDSTRAVYLIQNLHKQGRAVLMLGSSGTAKTTAALVYFEEFDPEEMVLKKINFSSATTAGMFQRNIEGELDKRGGKNFGPPAGKRMTVFLDDLSMPEVNEWGDQPTLEVVRQLMETSSIAFLDKDKRGDLKVIEDLLYVGAMNSPGGGKNDIGNRLKRQFFKFNMLPPTTTSINDIYGQMLGGRFPVEVVGREMNEMAMRLTSMTLRVWNWARKTLLPTPTKFHYVFNMRELSRVFHGVLRTPLRSLDSDRAMVQLWRHECLRVMSDKLTNAVDKGALKREVDSVAGVALPRLPPRERALLVEDTYWVDFLRDNEYDEDGVLVAEAPLVYEMGGSLPMLRERVEGFLSQYNEETKLGVMNLVLFDDALGHLMRITRVLATRRGSMLLVGVGGSGKQSLTRLASFICKHDLFQISLTKAYNVNSLLDDIRQLYKLAGQQNRPVTFLFTDAEIKDEAFLEYINSILMTGEVTNLFPKDELQIMATELRADALKARPGFVDSVDNLVRFFIDRVRDNLHVVLCMSPVSAKFAERARKFPGLINGSTVDWFLPWPRDALISVSETFIADYPLECDPSVKLELIQHMGEVHGKVVDACGLYFSQMRRHVYQTPKSFLSFLAEYKRVYADKLAEIKTKESRVELGLQKLLRGAEDVERMKVDLVEEEVKLAKAEQATNAMLGNLEISSMEAKKESDAVEKIKEACEADNQAIAAEKAQAEEDLAKAKPFLDEAERAVNSIKPNDLNELKKLAKPSDIIKLIFDCVGILFMQRVGKVERKPVTLGIGKDKATFDFVKDSYAGMKSGMLADARFLQNIFHFSRYEKDFINDETTELIQPYLDLQGFVPAVARNASKAAEGLCCWVRAMSSYHEASKVVKPKLEALRVAEGRLEVAQQHLDAAEAKLQRCQDVLAQLQADFEAQMATKASIEENAAQTRQKMEQATALINGLASERQRWNEDSLTFSRLKERLVGDVALVCAFVSYCGAFNQEFRSFLLSKFSADLADRHVPATEGLDVTAFIADVTTLSDWTAQGLPTDPLSQQNGVLVTRGSRYPLLIDPQGQGLHWIKMREADNLPIFDTTTLTHPKLREQLEHCMAEGKAMIIAGVEEEIDPLLNPVLEKQIITRAKSMYINVADKLCDFSPNFKLYLTTRLPNPHFSPELQARTTIVDFTVTQRGLEEQLLGRVIQKEQRSLEEQLTQVLEEVSSNQRSLLHLDAMLLERLTANDGNLLDDLELITVLADTKTKALEVLEKLRAADDMRSGINEKREQYRPVATRGSVLYFAMVDMTQVNCMYQTSLDQFLVQFELSMDVAEKASLATKRVANIIYSMTYGVYRYVNRGLYERHKQSFVLISLLKMLVTAGKLRAADVMLLLKGGAALDQNAVRPKPFAWLPSTAWLNVLQVADDCRAFARLPDDMVRGEAAWRRWYEDNEPEGLPVPDLEQAIQNAGDTSFFYRLLIVRALRPDRCLLSIVEFIKMTEVIDVGGALLPALGPRFVEPVTDTPETVYDDMTAEIPVIYLLSAGADPTDSIEHLARRKKQSLQCVSMGEGQETVAMKAINSAMVNGSWIFLQNCHLGLGFMNGLEDLMARIKETASPDFRLFLSADPTEHFPIGLLQMCIKVTNEPPAGLKAGLLRSYQVMVDQEKLERVDSNQWRALVFTVCFLHSIVQERRKFGSLGWNIPYEFNMADLAASLTFLEKHLYTGPVSWPTLQYMVAEVQYGGKVTDDMDRRLFNTYSEAWLSPGTLAVNFTFNPDTTVQRMPNDFVYSVQDGQEIEEYHAYINSFPEVDTPEIFGLHPNADLTFRVKEVTALLDIILETQPRQSVASGGATREDQVNEKAKELLERMVADYAEDYYEDRITAMGGLEQPLNIFLLQEIQRLQAVISMARRTLQLLQQAIRGEVSVTPALNDAMNAIFDARVPRAWMYSSGGDEISWISPSLGLWYSGLLDRDAQLRRWLDHGRPNTYWLSGFFNPQGFLTAMQQEVTRLHAADNWALDTVVVHTEVTEFADHEQVRQPPREGVFVHGLFLEGAGWDRGDNSVVESEPKVVFTALPVLFVTAITEAQQKSRSGDYGPYGAYQCPCYKYPRRTAQYLVFNVNLPSRSQRPMHWTLRGLALLLSTA